MPSRLELYCSGYELSKVPKIRESIEKAAKEGTNPPKPPTSGSNAYKPNPNYVPPSSKNKDNVILTFREYNDMLTKIYYLEGKTRWLESVNKHLAEEIQSLQKQSLSRKLRKVRCICKLRGKCQ